LATPLDGESKLWCRHFKGKLGLHIM
jgi:hypothetical protein